MTHLEEGVRDTLERLEKKYLELKESKDFDNFKYGYSLGLDLAIHFLKTDLKCKLRFLFSVDFNTFFCACAKNTVFC